MIFEYSHNRILESVVSEAFADSLSTVLLPKLEDIYGDSIHSILMYEDFLADRLVVEGDWYYPLSITTASGTHRRWIKWNISSKKSFLDGNPYAYVGVEPLEFSLAESVPEEFLALVEPRAMTYDKRWIRLCVDTTEPTALVGRYSQTFVDEMARQLTLAIQSAMGVEGFENSTLLLSLSFAPFTFMEHTSDSVTYRRLILTDKGCQQRDFWVKWTRLDSAEGYTVTDTPTEGSILFEIGEGVPQKIREKEYRYLARTDVNKYQSAMGKKTATEWRSLIKRAIKNGDLVRVSTDIELATHADTLAEKLHSIVLTTESTMATEMPAETIELVEETTKVDTVATVAEQTTEEDEFESELDAMLRRVLGDKADKKPNFDMLRGIEFDEGEEIGFDLGRTEGDMFSTEESIDTYTEEEEESLAISATAPLVIDAIIDEPTEGEGIETEELAEDQSIGSDEDIDHSEELADELESAEDDSTDKTEEPNEDEYITAVTSTLDSFFNEEPGSNSDYSSIDKSLATDGLLDEEPETQEDIDDIFYTPPTSKTTASAEKVEQKSTDATVLYSIVPDDEYPTYTSGDDFFGEDSSLPLGTDYSMTAEDYRIEEEVRRRLKAETDARAKAEEEARALRKEREMLRLQYQMLLEENRKREEREAQAVAEMKQREDARRAEELADRERAEQERRLRAQRAREEEAERIRVAEAARIALEEQRKIEEERARLEAERQEVLRAERERLEREEAERLEAERRMEEERRMVEERAKAESLRQKLPEMEMITRHAKILFRRNIDMNIIKRIKEIVESTLIREGKQELKIHMKAYSTDSYTINLDVTLPSTESDLVVTLVKAIGGGGLGVTKITLE